MLQAHLQASPDPGLGPALMHCSRFFTADPLGKPQMGYTPIQSKKLKFENKIIYK